jgi:NADH-quinone oxidoreductase subunit C
MTRVPSRTRSAKRPSSWPTTGSTLRCALRDTGPGSFELLADLCGVDYSTWGGRTGGLGSVVYHLLSLAHNWRLRVLFRAGRRVSGRSQRRRNLACANWFEREAFDLFGIMFPGIRICAGS